LLFYVRFYDADLHLSLCALEVVASGIDDIIVQTNIHSGFTSKRRAGHVCGVKGSGFSSGGCVRCRRCP
jgi:hypothetical protein